ncbi:uncharacterized protein LOC113324858 [Papaver somniferum]|uniref:uncharacterized protein LOC113324845 n=1 Tax=Papaver somniferum TaxID=3469 RepID=UPI000E6FDD96|nr:uncharacterized protein LOC113324845 [Papaver somniferum]XP_026428920.1 uncharacterized protein LOC113324848 [Papaver somniferum]XP_026428929.1 uncharacterized protein LOC113324858 [Papaver somniferum]
MEKKMAPWEWKFLIKDGKVKSGRSLWFRHDWWIEKKAFKEKYSRLYKIRRKKNATVASMTNSTWNFEFSRMLNPAERIDLLEIKFDLRNVILETVREDRYEGECTAKSIYIKLTETNVVWEYNRILKTKLVPPKVLFFIWASLYDSIPIRSMLQIQGLQLQSNLCVFSNTQVETVEHFFLHCSWESHIWCSFLTSLQLPWVLPKDIKDLILIWSAYGVSQRKKIVCAASSILDL